MLSAEQFVNAPDPVWAKSDPSGMEGHTCHVEVSSPIPNGEEIEWSWDWDYIFDTLREQLGEEAASWDIAGEECWNLSEDLGTLYLVLKVEGADCELCRERAEYAAMCQGEQGQLL